jgi:hypothetical protein
MCASRSRNIDPVDRAGAIFAKTLELSFRLLPSARVVIPPVSCHGLAY